MSANHDELLPYEIVQISKNSRTKKKVLMHL